MSQGRSWPHVERRRAIQVAGTPEVQTRASNTRTATSRRLQTRSDQHRTACARLVLLSRGSLRATPLLCHPLQAPGGRSSSHVGLWTLFKAVCGDLDHRTVEYSGAEIGKHERHRFGEKDIFAPRLERRQKEASA